MQMENTDVFKIGLSTNPDRRLKSINQNTPPKMKIIAEIRCGEQEKARILERQLLDATENYRTKGEWIKVDFVKLMAITCDVLDSWEREELHVAVIVAEQKE